MAHRKQSSEVYGILTKKQVRHTFVFRMTYLHIQSITVTLGRQENTHEHHAYLLEPVAKFRQTGSVVNKKRNIKNLVRNVAL